MRFLEMPAEDRALWPHYFYLAANFFAISTAGGKVKVLLTGLTAYAISFLILLVVFYSHERTKVGPLARRVLVIMTQMAAIFALAPATLYVLLMGLLRKHR
jgi:hypothetical protein